jgi:adenylate cyclase, class 2
MPTEIEVKMRVESHDAIRSRLSAAGGARRGVTEEVNTFFDSPLAELRKSDRGLRVRRNRRQGQADELVVTYKGPKQQRGQYKVREEIEVGVTDQDSLVVLFERLGFGVTLRFEKTRETWELLGCTVELDDLPQLGRFVEVEGPDEASVRRAVEALGLAGVPTVKESYAELIAAAGVSAGGGGGVGGGQRAG